MAGEGAWAVEDAVGDPEGGDQAIDLPLADDISVKQPIDLWLGAQKP